MSDAGPDAPESPNGRTPPPASRRFGPWRRELRAFLELLALAGIAVAQPAFDLLTKNSELFVTLRSTRNEAITITLLIVLVPPLALWIIEALAGIIYPPARRFAHALLAGLVVAVIAIEVLKNQLDLVADGSGLPARVVAAAFVAGAAAAFLILRFEVVRLWLRYLAIAPAIFAVLFLLSAPITTAVFEGGPGAAADVRVGKPDRVVMIVLDELPLESLLDGNGRVDAELFPNFASLAGDSTWYRNSTTVAPKTKQAVPAILAGEIPTDNSIASVASEYPHNIFTMLGDTYEMNVHEPVTHLCPTNFCGARRTGRHGLGPLIDNTYDLWRGWAFPKDEGSEIMFDASFLTGASSGAAHSFVSSLEPSSGPRLDFLHLLLPHQPWHLRGNLQDDFQEQLTTGMNVSQWPDAWTALAARQRHLLQLQATDTLLGDVIRKLKRIDAYDQSLLVLTADHGVAFRAGSPIRSVTPENYSEIMWTPLFVKTPGQAAGRVDDRPANSIDVLPTIADLLDASVPWKLEGTSIVAKPRADGPRPFFGKKAITVDGPKGFAAAVQGRATTATGDPALRLYRLGPYGDLVGRRAAGLVDPAQRGPDGVIEHTNGLEDVDPEARNIPWSYVEGHLLAVPAGQPIAITVNGVIAGMATTVPHAADPGRTDFWATLPPQLFKPGRNEVRAFVVIGDPAAPILAEVRRPR